VKLGEFQRAIEEWIPPATAWKGDNTGIQIGRTDATVTNILLALDVTLEAAKEAVERRANLIVTHHPLLFHPLRSLTQKSRAGEIALYLAERKINLYAAHTNLDHVQGGVSFAMASILGLKNVRMLTHLKASILKVVVFVPEKYVEKVAGAMHRAGGGTFTKYEECSFRSEGIGTFKGTRGSHPFVGSAGVLEKTRETKLEMIVEVGNMREVVPAMIKAHPYEEVAYDLIPLHNDDQEHGLGAIGEFPETLSQGKFLSRTKRTLGVPLLRYTGKAARGIRRVAVCGGAGIEAMEEAVRQQADAFITADVKYHSFQDAERDIVLVDAGHYETERHVLPTLAARIKSIVRAHHASSKVLITRKNTNPVSYI